MSDIKHGDRVRVVAEGLAHNNGRYTVVQNDNDDWLVEYRNGAVGNGVKVEKIEPPVEVFQPGDVVRSKRDGSSTYTITNDGYVSHQTGDHWHDGREYCERQFTSEYYERVDLG